VGQNVFIHTGAENISNPAGNGTITIRFSSAASSANPAMTFGPVEREGSALWLINERSDDIYPLVIELPSGSEDIFTGVTLTASYNSPAQIIINGQNRVLKIKNPGAVITVGGGVTLTLRNIRFEGNNANTSPLFKVWPGGKLILEEGAIFADNQSTGAVGGIWVNGGYLNLNDGAEIKKMQGQRGGGILIDMNGRVIMSGGIIGGDVDGDGNTVIGEKGGGGVLVDEGIFDMYGGTIGYNKAAKKESGGGVGILDRGTFNLNAGTIKENTALELNSGGGVYILGNIISKIATFIMNGEEAEIKNNSVEKANSGGGIYVDNGVFTMYNGVIKGNTAKADNSGGGVFVLNGYTPYRMISGVIEGNTAQDDNSGGGVCVTGDTGVFEIYAGIIKGNTAQGFNSGGGVCFNSRGRFRMVNADAIIESNIAEKANSGGGVYTNNAGGFYMDSGVIKNNIAEGKQSGGGLYTASNFSYIFGSIKGNQATNSVISASSESGGGVYINGGNVQISSAIIGGIEPEDANIAVIGNNDVYIAGGYVR
jgi:hypothetical protein